MELDKAKKAKQKKLKAYRFRDASFTGYRSVFVLAHSKKEAGKILEKEGYGMLAATCEEVQKDPGVIYVTPERS